jgi:hypothetical protein
MPDLLALSARIIDDHVLDEPVNRVTQQLSELTDQLALVESFSHLVGLRTADGLVVFDASSAATAPAVVAALRGWDRSPVATLVYTHGHLDHTGGSTALLADAERRGHRRPEVVAHRAVVDRLARYRLTAGYNAAINARQFGWLRGARTAPPPGATAGAPSPAPGAAATDAAPAVGIPAEATHWATWRMSARAWWCSPASNPTHMVATARAATPATYRVITLSAFPWRCSFIISSCMSSS